MDSRSSSGKKAQAALWGLFMGDALAMPVHWYYDRQALKQDYGEVRDYLVPRNPHPGSILHRSHYKPINPEADILHDQSQYWGRGGVHYHQHLSAGENTLNLKLSQLLMGQLNDQGGYSSDLYLENMIAFLRNPDSHCDTYVEEWVRGFFTRRAQGVPLGECGVTEKHIGGLAGPVALLIAFHEEPETARALAHEHLSLTHKGPAMAQALDAVATVLLPVLAGAPLIQTIEKARSQGNNRYLGVRFDKYAGRDDLEVIGRMISPACYVEDSVPAVFFLAQKYANDPEEGLVANTMVGGDNCYRGAVLGAILGAEGGMEGWPLRWQEGLVYQPVLPLVTG